MERCYVCNHCGKCDDDALAIAPPVLACLDCGHEVQRGKVPAPAPHVAAGASN